MELGAAIQLTTEGDTLNQVQMDEKVQAGDWENDLYFTILRLRYLQKIPVNMPSQQIELGVRIQMRRAVWKSVIFRRQLF